MKKAVSIFILLVLLTLALVSCGSIETYEENLGRHYEIEFFDEEDLEEMLEDLDEDADDYGLVGGFYAYHEDDYDSVIVLECKSAKAASTLAEDIEDADVLGSSAKIVTDGKFVLAGDRNAVNDALGK